VELRLVSRCFAGTGYGYTTHHVNSRLLRQFTVLNIPMPMDHSLHTIYSHMLQSKLNEFPQSWFDRRSELVEVVLLNRCICLHLLAHLFCTIAVLCYLMRVIFLFCMLFICHFMNGFFACQLS